MTNGTRKLVEAIQIAQDCSLHDAIRLLNSESDQFYDGDCQDNPEEILESLGLEPDYVIHFLTYAETRRRDFYHD